MPEPVTNAQIEDVLSSIRRLVSEETRSEPQPGAGARPAAAAAKGAPAPATDAGRLVLTPSLRVDEDTEESQLQKEIAAAWNDGAWAEPGAEASRPSLDAGDAFVAEELAAQIPDPETAELALADNDEALLAESGFDDGYDGIPESGAGRAPEEVAEAGQPAAAPLDLSVALRHVAAAAETAAEDTGKAVGAPAGEEAGEEPAASVEDEAPFAEPAFHSTRSESLSAKIEALEAAIGRTRDQWEPDGAGGDAYAGTPVDTIIWRDHTEEDDMSGPHAGTGAEDGDLLPQDEAVLDEDSLRELVAEIVRQELQGALGERITRNVRKLVRREIHRALAAQDLD